MSIQNEIINSGRKQKLKSPEVYRTGRVNNSGAYLRGPKADPTAGKGQASMANFIGGMSKMFDLGVNVQQDWVKDEEARGKAHWTKASPELRTKLRNAIKTGTMSESESFAWRQGVSEAYTASLLGEYNTELFQAYERNEFGFNKNDEKSGSLQAFIDKFDEQYKQHFETIDEETLLEHFVPSQMGIQRQLQQRHTEHLNSEYVRHSMNAKQGAVFEMFRGGAFVDIALELNKGDHKVEDLVIGGGKDNQTRLEHLTELEDHLIEFEKSKTLSSDFESWLNKQPGGIEVIKELKAMSGKDPEKIETPKKKKVVKRVGVLEPSKIPTDEDEKRLWMKERGLTWDHLRGYNAGDIYPRT
tara:strand:+ start:43 stop:1113 length:1071 start_codon:yes stop_codon:yes gene_type:complete